MLHRSPTEGPPRPHQLDHFQRGPIHTAAQAAWLQLYQGVRANPQRQHRQQSSSRPTPFQPAAPHRSTQQLDDEAPAIGANHDFIIPQPWPDDIVYINRSVFSASRPFPVLSQSEYIYESCNCWDCCVSATGSYLTSGCVNVNTATVCDENNCLLGPRCGNRFETRYPLDLIQSKVGLGVVSSLRIPKGAFIVEYVGEIVYLDDVDESDDQRYQAQFRSQAAWSNGSTILVDALRCGNESRFINHSCQPNSVLYEFDWANTMRLGIFAADNIPPLQELTFRYSHRSRQQFECRCPAHIIGTS